MTTPSLFLSIPILGAVIVLYQLLLSFRWNQKYKLPPRVPGWPIVGNALDVPFPGGMWGVKMAKKYGDMFTVNLGGKDMVFINSSRIVQDLLEKRASIYSSRPWRPLGSDIMSGGNRGVLLPYGTKWRNQRKIAHSILNGRLAEKQFVPYQNLESKQLVYEYLTNPENFHLANQRFSNSVMTSVVFGRRAKEHDLALKNMLQVVADLAEVLFDPLKAAVDSYYWLNYLPKPLQWWRKMGEKYYKDSLVLYQAEYDALLKKMENGTARPCFAVDMVRSGDKKEYQIDEEERLVILAALLEAGSDTSRTFMTQLVAAMAVYPDWVKKARAMLDEVCGANAERLPTLDDRSKLPYITAVVKEGLRWRPFNQLGQPHMLIQDDEYEGYKFPAGTQFTWNAYAISLSEENYENPMEFMPERFMNDDLQNLLKGHWAFGAGRRVCVGYNVGSNNGWILAACLLYCFDIKQDPDHPIDTLNSQWDILDEPPFKVIITPRSEAHADLIRRCAPEALNADY